ncbi:hypothetical protein IC607_13885 [Cellulomonas sp. JH27-2]|uniref:hypothetical protein n=1 Tax=Cellulomonas sp. JH27-2 TaxID=2774139 RepID=UPI0017807A1F|nr:hypothetical protein [Cellulomonas sp. JH27-2]MBD8060061.1 hypothetical protein [Cellulomonas sp. JH27-2]
MLAVSLWAGALVLLWVVGLALDRSGAVVTFGSLPPLLGHAAVRASVGTLLAVVVAGAVVWRGHMRARTMRWGPLLASGWAVSAVFAVALATTRGWSALSAPLRGEHDYLVVVPTAAAAPGDFLRTFTDRALEYPIHVRGHPPGFVLLATGMDRIGLGGAGWATALVVMVGSSAVVAVAVTLRALAGPAGEDVARRAMPAAVLAPAVLWIATSADALYAGVLAWGVALLALASTRRHWWPWALAAGLVLGACPFLSYGLLHMAVVALAPLVVTRRWRPTALAAAVVLGCVAAWAVAGFWIGDGIAVTHLASSHGRSADRPYLYFALADLAVLGLLVGPAGVGGLAGLRRLPRPVVVLVAFALGTAVLGAFSGVERGEVERIWLPLACWVAPAAATLTGPHQRRWLVAQAATTVALAVLLDSPW